MKGNRCKISEEYFAHNKMSERHTLMYRARRGVITGESRDRAAWLVIWDGSKTPDGWHKDYIEVETGS